MSILVDSTPNAQDIILNKKANYVYKKRSTKSDNNLKLKDCVYINVVIELNW